VVEEVLAFVYSLFVTIPASDEQTDTQTSDDSIYAVGINADACKNYTKQNRGDEKAACEGDDRENK